MASAWTFDLCGGHLALDFANTVSGRWRAAPIERLPSYDAVVEFGRQVGLYDATRAGQLTTWAAAHPREALLVERRALALREALHQIFLACAEARPPAEADLDVLDGEHARLRLGADFAWAWRAGPDAPDAMLGPIVRAAIDLATSDGRARVRLCELDSCRWIFLDSSKNHSRRWCDMKVCGNRAKARRFSARQKGRRAPRAE